MPETNGEAQKTSMGSLPETVGIWIELDVSTLQRCHGEGLIRWLRCIIMGIDELPAVKEVVIPCSYKAAPVMRQLFAESGCYGDGQYLVSKKLQVKAFSFNGSSVESLREWLGRKIVYLENRLDSVGESVGSKKILKQVFRKIFEKPRTLRHLLERFALSVICIKDLALRELLLKLLRRVPSPRFDNLALKASESFPAASWVIANPAWKNGATLEGRRIVAIPDLVYREFPLKGFDEKDLQTHTNTVCKLVTAAEKIICFSSHVTHQQIAGLLPDHDSEKIRIVPHAPIHTGSFSDSQNDSRIQLGNELRQFFSSEQMHRHYCDFPFERMRYVMVSSQVRPHKNYKRILEVYDAILRRHRRNIKLVVTGNLDSDHELAFFLQEKGLVFDVIQSWNVGEDLHSRLIRHAELIVIPTLFEGGMPFAFAESVGMGTPCAFSRIPAFTELLTEQELAGPEVFNPRDSGSIERTILHVLDHRDEVLKRQKLVIERLSQRTWTNVAEECLGY